MNKLTNLNKYQGQATFACLWTISRLIQKLFVSKVLFPHEVAIRDFSFRHSLFAFCTCVRGTGMSRSCDNSLLAAGLVTPNIWGLCLKHSNTSLPFSQLWPFNITIGGWAAELDEAKWMVCLWTARSLTLIFGFKQHFTWHWLQMQPFIETWHSAPRSLHTILRKFGLSIR